MWRSSDPRFGGISGVEVTDGGAGVVAIGDRGVWVTARLKREDGRLTGVETTGIGPLLGVSGKPLEELESDAEGLRLDARGRAYVSYEGYHRVRRYDAIDGPATTIRGPAGFETLGWNTGLESVAIDAEGVVYAIPERARRGVVPVFRYRGGVWDDKLEIQRRDGFLIVDADFGPDGNLYMLERKFKWLGGFATRLRRLHLGPEGVEGETALLTTRYGELDNMEGISAWRDDKGQMRVTMVSDDNFFPLQQTVILEYFVKDAEISAR